MNEEIKKFFEQFRGRPVLHNKNLGYYYQTEFNFGIRLVACHISLVQIMKSEVNPKELNELIFPFKGNIYSEKEMLKIIKMKAFI